MKLNEPELQKWKRKTLEMQNFSEGFFSGYSKPERWIPRYVWILSRVDLNFNICSTPLLQLANMPQLTYTLLAPKASGPHSTTEETKKKKKGLSI